jgi:hypothetical protein
MRPMYICDNIIAEFFLKMKNRSDERCRENQNTDFMFSNSFPKIVPFMG